MRGECKRDMTERIRENSAFSAQAVDVRGIYFFVAVNTDVVGSQSVYGDYQKVERVSEVRKSRSFSQDENYDNQIKDDEPHGDDICGDFWEFAHSTLAKLSMMNQALK